MEEYKQIPGYENYAISRRGEVKNLKTGKILKQIQHNRGYLRVSLYTEYPKFNSVAVHAAMAITYLNHTPDKTGYIVIDHIDGDKHNNLLENLQITTQRHNRTKSIVKTNGLPTGVVKVRNRYAAQIRKDKKHIYLGMFDTPEEAHLAYLAAIPN